MLLRFNCWRNSYYFYLSHLKKGECLLLLMPKFFYLIKIISVRCFISLNFVSHILHNYYYFYLNIGDYFTNLLHNKNDDIKEREELQSDTGSECDSNRCSCKSRNWGRRLRISSRSNDVFLAQRYRCFCSVSVERWYRNQIRNLSEIIKFSQYCV